MKLSLFLKIPIYFVVLVKLYLTPHLNSMKHKIYKLNNKIKQYESLISKI